MSSTLPCWSTARHRYRCAPLIETNTSSRCHLSPSRRPRRRSWFAYSCPNRSHQARIVSFRASAPARRGSSTGTVTLRSCGRSANHISLIRHTRTGESRRRTGENRPRSAQVDSAIVSRGQLTPRIPTLRTKSLPEPAHHTLQAQTPHPLDTERRQLDSAGAGPAVTPKMTMPQRHTRPSAREPGSLVAAVRYESWLLAEPESA
jgi:hypothetical protein